MLDEEIEYPSPEQADRLHRKVLEATGGERGHLSMSNLEYVLGAVQDVGERLDRRQSLVKKAAFLLSNLILLHPFTNGNKRTAMELVRLFLRVNGLELRAEPKDAYSFALDVAKSRATKSDVDDWIARNLSEFKGK